MVRAFFISSDVVNHFILGGFEVSGLAWCPCNVIVVYPHLVLGERYILLIVVDTHLVLAERKYIDTLNELQ